MPSLHMGARMIRERETYIARNRAVMGADNATRQGRSLLLLAHSFTS